MFGRHKKDYKSGSKLLEILTREYIEEVRSAGRLAHHAERMVYPQYREKLRQMAEEERKHAAWLAEKILGVGGQIPEVPADAEEAKNSWEALVLDLEGEKRCVADLVEAIAIVRSTHPDIADGLERILEAEEKQRDQIIDMLMKSDPQAGWAA
jgi:bacterioferritin (cytochrome b1)